MIQHNTKIIQNNTKLRKNSTTNAIQNDKQNTKARQKTKSIQTIQYMIYKIKTTNAVQHIHN